MQATAQQGNLQKQWGRLVAEVWSDESLKARLIEDPKTVLREYGIEAPFGVELKIVEDSSDVRHLVLPPNPSAEMTDEELSGSSETYSYSYSYSRSCGRCGRCGCGCNHS